MGRRRWRRGLFRCVRAVVVPPSRWCCFHLQPGAGAPSESPVFWPRSWMGSLLAELVCGALWFLHSYTQRQRHASSQGVYLLQRKGRWWGWGEVRGATTFWPRIILCMYLCGPVRAHASAASKCLPCLLNEHLSVFLRSRSAAMEWTLMGHLPLHRGYPPDFKEFGGTGSIFFGGEGVRKYPFPPLDREKEV